MKKNEIKRMRDELVRQYRGPDQKPEDKARAEQLADRAVAEYVRRREAG